MSGTSQTATLAVTSVTSTTTTKVGAESAPATTSLGSALTLTITVRGPP